MAHHYHNTNTRFDPQNHYSTPTPPGQYGQSIEHPPPPPPGQYGQSVEHPPPPPPGQYGQSVEYPLPPGQYGQSVEHHSSVSSLHSDIGSYNTADYYQTGVMFRDMVHQLAENNARSNFTAALETSRTYNVATMLPIAWEETYPESVGIREDIHSLVRGESFRRATVMPNIKLGADNTELATIVSQSMQLILCANTTEEANVTAFPTSKHK